MYFIIFLNKVEATIVGHESCDLLNVIRRLWIKIYYYSNSSLFRTRIPCRINMGRWRVKKSTKGMQMEDGTLIQYKERKGEERNQRMRSVTILDQLHTTARYLFYPMEMVRKIPSLHG